MHNFIVGFEIVDILLNETVKLYDIHSLNNIIKAFNRNHQKHI